MTWWRGLPGLDWRYPPESRALADRVVALVCAARLRPWDSSAGAYGSHETTKTALVFLNWLEGAQGEADAYTRRLALCVACADLGPQPPRQDQVVLAAKEVVKFLAQERRLWPPSPGAAPCGSADPSGATGRGARRTPDARASRARARDSVPARPTHPVTTTCNH